MTVITTIPLLDGPLMDDASRRKDKVQRMALDLLRFSAAGNEADAIRCLYGTRRYPMADIVMLVNDARQVAQQEIVSIEMSRPAP